MQDTVGKDFIKRFYINYEECKFEGVKAFIDEAVSFILTMRNVNFEDGYRLDCVALFYINYEECKSTTTITSKVSTF